MDFGEGLSGPGNVYPAYQGGRISTREESLKTGCWTLLIID